MNEFEFSVRTLCLMDKANLERMLKEKDPVHGFSAEEIKEALRVYDSCEHEKRREALRKEL